MKPRFEIDTADMQTPQAGHKLWQWLSENLAVEHGYIADIVAGMFENGFIPHRDFRVI